ncbi:uncharacterized protein LOC134518843 [Chroicocephalus ridibundus]|uniref:uncharacterized protein LOC134518843 n=1 Tax=Chroicocephalus ridibundus TaxID=1192867 RepID=UPI002FDE053A
MPCCVFDGHANASDAVWLVVAFANGERPLLRHVLPAMAGRCGGPSPQPLTPHPCRAASDAFRNPPSRDDVPPYERLPTAHSYMTLETAAAAYACPAPSPAVLRVGGDTACGGEGGRDPCNGPLPSPGPYRVKFLVMGCHGPKADTRWSDPILLRRAASPSTIDPAPVRRDSAPVVVASILASLGAALAAAVLGAVGAEAWGSLCRRDPGNGAFAHRSYRTHHIPPALPQPLPPGCGCSPPGLGCFAPRRPGPCPADTPRRRALGCSKCSPGETSPTCLPPGPWLAQECGRLAAAGGSRGDAEPGRPHSCPRHSGARTMLPLLLLLLATARGLDGLPTLEAPVLASSSLGGQKTTSTFVLDQPRCVFTNVSKDTVIWLVVADPRAVPDFDNSVEPGGPGREFQQFLNSTFAYMTLNTTILNYPCPKNPGDITVLRVGSETRCAKDKKRPTCNGPLPGPGPYQVKFLALDGSKPVAQTAWSEPITLSTAQPSGNIPVPGSGHSAGMIALTSILSILFAILLAGLVAMLLWGSDASSGSSTFSKPEAVTVRRYNTHHVYDQPAARL